MTETTDIALKKQYKLLKKAIKSELKKSLKGGRGHSRKLMALSALDIKILAKEMVAQALEDNELSADVQVIRKIEPKPSNMSFALKPLKNSPCKQCPALNGGLCLCAIKYNDKKRIGSAS
ncbi:hypothetical protein [Pseudoalteromonas sp. NBT06-2]|uniref:hypothetical protein n=1 Tax=Pseudoalteromonas sp. NBT06-2 TaxID=2025950 RepID=UPI000BA6A781|nr:hypothetical protein [Pseudoalteromonas sp. NBT06-2]